MAKENGFEKIVPEDMFFGGDLKVLICYMLTAVNEAIPIVETAQLFHYEGVANYFDTQTAIFELETEEYITKDKNFSDMIIVTQKGRNLANALKDSVSAVLREKVYDVVVKMLTRYKAERDTNIKIEEKKNGFLLTYSVLGGEEEILSFSIMLPNMAQANHLKEHILKNPKHYCDSFIELLTENLQNTEEDK